MKNFMLELGSEITNSLIHMMFLVIGFYIVFYPQDMIQNLDNWLKHWF